MFKLRGKSIAFIVSLLLVSQISISASAKTFLSLDDINRMDDVNYKIEGLSVSGIDEATMISISVDNGAFEIKEDKDKYSINYDILSEHKNALLVFNEEIPLDEVKEILLKNITYSVSDSKSQKVSITISDNKVKIPDGVSVSIKNIAGIKHYYMYVDIGESTSWIEAYNLAKTYRLDGLKGYLATITSKEEDDVLKSISQKGAWSGGTRLILNENYDSDEVSIKDKDGENYVWADGPEKGVIYYKGIKNGVNIYKASGNGNGWGWKSGEPNDLGGEQCMQVNFSETREWNDLAYDAPAIKGFFVEFSKYGNNVGNNSKRVAGTIEVKPLSLLEKEKLNDIKINYITKKIVDLVNGKYKIDGTEVNVSDGTIDVADKLGQSIEVIKCGDGIKTRDSDPKEVDIKDMASESDVSYDVVQPDKTVNTGTINIPKDEEYSLDNGTTWKDGEGNDLTDLQNGSEVLVRKKATVDNPESKTKAIKIGKNVNKKHGTGVVNNIKKLIGGTVKTGDVSSILALIVIASVSGGVAFLKRKRL